MKTPFHARARAFTLIEVVVALAVFGAAFVGLIAAMDSGIKAGLEARELETMRGILENRLAFCLAVPPPPGATREIAASENLGIAVRETRELFPAQNKDGEELQGLWLLTIEVEAGEIRDSLETVVYLP